MTVGLKSLVLIGHGMVGHKLLTELVARGVTRRYRVTVFAEERQPAYNRVALSSYFDGSSARDLSLVEPGFLESSGIELFLADPVASIDRQARTVTTASGRTATYDALVLATGSSPFVPPVPGHRSSGCFAYRTLDDLDALRAWSRNATAGVVLGGGLLGLEAANALLSLGLETHVVEIAPHLMPLQVDEGGGAALRRRIEALAVHVHTSTRTEAILVDREGKVRALRFAEGPELPVDLVVFSAGIRPRDELARASGLAVGERGGVVVDERCRTSDERIYAIGECALAHGTTWGLVAPGNAMAEVVADALAGGPRTFQGADAATKLKLLGVEVASFGDVHGKSLGAQEIVFKDRVANVYKKLVLSEDARLVLGGVLVGDAAAYGALVHMFRHRMPVPEHPEDLILPARAASDGGGPVGAGSLPDEAVICSCHNVTKAQICGAIAREGLRDVAAVKACTKAGSGCGGCATLLADLLRLELDKAGITTHDGLCEHFTASRQELFDRLRLEEITSFAELLQRYGRGRGCEVCKPAVASMLASLARHDYVLSGENASLQDTNDRYLANLQKDGSYSVVPRIPGGEITPDKLLVLATVARDFSLYTKITGGQRIDLFGARVEDLPAIWRRLVDAGFESGHAYAKALRTVKSCVGSTWCRYGVGDSVALAIAIELRYRGLRAPHKIKGAVSGCTRECAEAQSKDFGVIATDKGWNLYICGNGGMRPQHAALFARDLDQATLIRILDRFLMFYIRTAGRLERTASWLNKRPGGIEELRRILVDDELGLCAELEADLARHVASYRCEWRATLEDPTQLSRFVHFINAPGGDPNIVFVQERDQIRPARPEEKRPPEVLAAGAVDVDGVVQVRDPDPGTAANASATLSRVASEETEKPWNTKL